MDRTKGEWSKNFWIEAAASIFLPLESKSWEMRNLSMCETIECAPDLSLSKVNSFANIFQKLSSYHASIKPHWSVKWCHTIASFLCIQRFPATLLRSVSSQWLKSPPRMKWSAVRFASFNRFHIDVLSFEEQVA